MPLYLDAHAVRTEQLIKWHGSPADASIPLNALHSRDFNASLASARHINMHPSNFLRSDVRPVFGIQARILGVARDEPQQVHFLRQITGITFLQGAKIGVVKLADDDITPKDPQRHHAWCNLVYLNGFERFHSITNRSSSRQNGERRVHVSAGDDIDIFFDMPHGLASQWESLSPALQSALQINGVPHFTTLEKNPTIQILHPRFLNVQELLDGKYPHQAHVSSPPIPVTRQVPTTPTTFSTATRPPVANPLAPNNQSPQLMPAQFITAYVSISCVFVAARNDGRGFLALFHPDGYGATTRLLTTSTKSQAQDALQIEVNNAGNGIDFRKWQHGTEIWIRGKITQLPDAGHPQRFGIESASIGWQVAPKWHNELVLSGKLARPRGKCFIPPKTNRGKTLRLAAPFSGGASIPLIIEGEPRETFLNYTRTNRAGETVMIGQLAAYNNERPLPVRSVKLVRDLDAYAQHMIATAAIQSTPTRDELA